MKLRLIKYNIFIYNFVEEDGENMFIKILVLFKEYLGVDIKFINIYRNGWGK